MTVILETMPFGAARREWQDWIQTIQSLDGTLLINAEDRGMQGRFEVQPDNVGSLLLKLRIIAGSCSYANGGVGAQIAATPG